MPCTLSPFHKTLTSSFLHSLFLSSSSSSCHPDWPIDQTMPQRTSFNYKNLHLFFKNCTWRLPWFSNAVLCFCLTDLFTCWFVFPPSLSLLQSLLQSISLFLFPSSLPSPFCCEGHQASGDPVPQEESKRPPSLLLFFHNLLFMSDRPPPDKWLPYGERKTEKQSRRKEGKTLSASSVFSGLVCYYSLVLKL